ncbi:MAG TPA: hypothetical protein ENN40_04380 [Candidatus Aminicenantes bacterium]|nr:hypothetical protein [Candidatus Aminicenantes bacterium]
MKKKDILIGLVSLFVLVSGFADGARELPLLIKSLKIGTKFNTGAENVHTFESQDGKLSYVWMCPDEDFPVNVELDAEGKIARLAWETTAQNQEEAATLADEHKTEYQQFFRGRTELDQGYAIHFESDTLHYVIRVEATLVTFMTIAKGKGIDVELWLK